MITKIGIRCISLIRLARIRSRETGPAQIEKGAWLSTAMVDSLPKPSNMTNAPSCHFVTNKKATPHSEKTLPDASVGNQDTQPYQPHKIKYHIKWYAQLLSAQARNLQRGL